MPSGRLKLTTMSSPVSELGLLGTRTCWPFVAPTGPTGRLTHVPSTYSVGSGPSASMSSLSSCCAMANRRGRNGNWQIDETKTAPEKKLLVIAITYPCDGSSISNCSLTCGLDLKDARHTLLPEAEPLSGRSSPLVMAPMPVSFCARNHASPIATLPGIVNKARNCRSSAGLLHTLVRDVCGDPGLTHIMLILLITGSGHVSR